VHPSGVEELTAGDPREVVVENARRKARAVEGQVVLGADTEVFFDGHVLGKPRDEDEARAFLRQLSGRVHEVHGGIVVRDRAGERAASAVTGVRFRLLEPAEVDRYVAIGEWHGRAGGYAIQGRGAALVDRIEGDFWNVVGLPVPELVSLLPELFGRTASPGTRDSAG
jgi:septum formation protein